MAVVQLALTTAFNWRTLRSEALSKGIPNLMYLDSMHAVLDFSETLGLKTAVSGAKTETEFLSAQSDFYDGLYRPDDFDLAEASNAAAGPAPFSEEESATSFDAFLSALGG